ncbi:MAG: secondary thiamine-phosphate synthase enzyme YjbQ [Candidatus Micrarchaeia archaeon]
MYEFSITTSSKIGIVDITEEVMRAVTGAKVDEGICVVYVPHATAGIIINEYEPNLKQDLLDMLQSIIREDSKYKHNTIDDNASAHLRSALTGSSVVLPISGHKLMLGTWQRIQLCEFDGPRRRTVYVSVIKSS